jgi:drug/metabolite transporter (DMT)-like permease
LTGALFISVVIALRILSNPLANVFQKKLSTGGNHPLMINFITYTILAFVGILFLTNADWHDLPADFWIYSLLGGIAGSLGNGFLVKALHLGDLSVLGPVNAYKSAIALLAGILFLGEIPNLTGITGIILIIAGSYFVLDTTPERFTWRLLRNRAIQYRIWAMFLTATEAVFIKKVIGASSAELAFAGWSLFGAFFSYWLLRFYKLRFRREVSRLTSVDAKRFTLLIICIGTMQLTTIYAFEHMPVGYALSLFQLSVIAGVFLGYRIFHEQNIRKKLAGSVIMLGGSVLIILMS